MLGKRICDNTNPDSVASRMRANRFLFFDSLLSQLPEPVKILDVGGTVEYWQSFKDCLHRKVYVTLFNLEKIEVDLPWVNSIQGDIRDMTNCENNKYDVVFSNSMIEHLGSFGDQNIAANNIRRVGRRYFIQTPDYYFPIEPHFVFPFFHYLPVSLRVCLLRHFDLGWIPKETDPDKARQIISSIRLLKLNEIKALFPEATIYKEKILGLTKSLTAYYWQ